MDPLYSAPIIKKDKIASIGLIASKIVLIFRLEFYTVRVFGLWSCKF